MAFPTFPKYSVQIKTGHAEQLALKKLEGQIQGLSNAIEKQNAAIADGERMIKDYKHVNQSSINARNASDSKTAIEITRLFTGYVDHDISPEIQRMERQLIAARKNLARMKAKKTLYEKEYTQAKAEYDKTISGKLQGFSNHIKEFLNSLTSTDIKIETISQSSEMKPAR